VPLWESPPRRRCDWWLQRGAPRSVYPVSADYKIIIWSS